MKISAATSSTAATTDLVPIARPADTTARQVTVSSLVQAYFKTAAQFGTVGTTGAKFHLASDDENTNFTVYTATSTFNGTVDNFILFGWNADGANAAEHRMMLAMESDYYVGGVHYCEMYFQHNNPDTATTYRPWQATISRATDLITNRLRGTLYLSNSPMTSDWFVLSEAGIITGTDAQILMNNTVISDQIKLTFQGTGGATISTSDTANLRLAGGARSSGGSYYALTTTAAVINMQAGSMYFYTDYNLTAGNTFTPSLRLAILNYGPINIYSDLTFEANEGPVLVDRSDGHTYRIKVTAGTLGTEVVT